VTGLAALGALSIGPHRIERPLIMAPMAGVSEAPYRVIAQELGAGLAPTELVSAKGLEYSNARTEAYLRHDPRREPTLSVQVFGGDPESMAQAAEIAASRGARILDINMGCPVKKVTRNGAGSALMCDPARAAAIVRAMRERIGDRIPITAKIRGGWDQNNRNAAEVGKALADAGVAALAIHPRTRTQGYSGKADWSLTAAVVKAVPIPVIANGDIVDVASADRVVRETGCAAIMIGRAALGNPWIFRELAAAHAGGPPPARPTREERTAMIVRHLEEQIEHIGDETHAVRKFRQHLIWYSRGMSDGSSFRQRVLQLESHESVVEAIVSFFSRAEEQDRAEAPLYDERQAFG
jgi:nifR3 family TIM-barrel protein